MSDGVKLANKQIIAICDNVVRQQLWARDVDDIMAKIRDELELHGVTICYVDVENILDAEQLAKLRARQEKHQKGLS